MRRFVFLTIASFALLAAPARGDGAPVGGYDPLGQVTTHGLDVRYAAVPARAGTVVMAIERSGQILKTRYLRRRWFVPAAAYDGSTTGLTATGGTLILTAPRIEYPAKHSEFVVVETRGLRGVQTVRLHGDFSLDAVSPDGSRLYFIQVLSNTDYVVRTYDFARGKLLPHPVVDPTDKEPLRGGPLSRAMSDDDRWAYTLYDGNTTHPFIHALDTVHGQAKCIDLDDLANRADLIDMRLKVAGDGTLLVRDGFRHTQFMIDPRTWAVRKARVAPPTQTPPPDDEGLGWAGPVAGLALLALLAAFTLRAVPRMRMR